tara:strand:- start:288 stop:422 length:135 start_codon:yes stop_codon:yes gene_type:complete
MALTREQQKFLDKEYRRIKKEHMQSLKKFREMRKQEILKSRRKK